MTMQRGSDNQPTITIPTNIWKEEAEPDNPFSAATCYCFGYDVYGDLLGKASWAEYLFLLFHGERPTTQEAKLLEGLAVALANPGPRDHSVQAAMNGGAGGSGNAASLMAALAVGAGNLGGAHEILVAMQYWEACGQNLEHWRAHLQEPPQEERTDVWLPMEHPPGFGPYGVGCATPVLQTLNHLVQFAPRDGALLWLEKNRSALEAEADCPLAMSGVAAAALHDLKLSPDQGEMLYLLLRLPGAAVHALERKRLGHKKFPAFDLDLQLTDDPGRAAHG